MSTSHLQQYPHVGLNGTDDSSRQQNPGNALLANPNGKPRGLKRTKPWTLRQKRPTDNSTLEEAVKEELSALPAKTPVSILQELLSRRGKTPNYELVQIEGAIHEPTFRYRVTVGDFVGVGFGGSKKAAKHAAAKNVLDKIVGNPVSDENVLADESEEPVKMVANPNGDKVPVNPVGTLQELCMSRRYPPPSYELHGEHGLPHERFFTITCVVLKHRETGTGRAKKTAKRQAAQKMWERLQNAANLPAEEETLETPEEAQARFSGLKTSKISTLTTPHTHKVAAFHKNLKASTGPKLSQLQMEEMNVPEFNYVQFLQEIASEQHFEVTYVDVEETSSTGKFQCLVQLSTLPVAVCYGSGKTSKDAQSAAAHNALDYLKIMTKK